MNSRIEHKAQVKRPVMEKHQDILSSRLEYFLAKV